MRAQQFNGVHELRMWQYSNIHPKAERELELLVAFRFYIQLDLNSRAHIKICLSPKGCLI
jgi:hypothetical protein